MSLRRCPDKLSWMRLLFIFAFCLSASVGVCQEGTSGVIKVRRSSAQTYFIPVDGMPTLQSTAATGSSQMAYSNGMVQFGVECTSCPSSGLVWLTINCSDRGEVEAVKIYTNDFPEIGAQLVLAAKQELSFKPMVIAQKPRAVQFIYPVMFVVL